MPQPVTPTLLAAAHEAAMGTSRRHHLVRVGLPETPRLYDDEEFEVLKAHTPLWTLIATFEPNA